MMDWNRPNSQCFHPTVVITKCYSSAEHTLFAKLVDYLLWPHFNKTSDSFDHFIDGKNAFHFKYLWSTRHGESPIERQCTNVLWFSRSHRMLWKMYKNLHAMWVSWDQLSMKKEKTGGSSLIFPSILVVVTSATRFCFPILLSRTLKYSGETRRVIASRSWKLILIFYSISRAPAI